MNTGAEPDGGALQEAVQLRYVEAVSEVRPSAAG